MSINPQQPSDQLGRPMRDLRISLIDQCNLRCRYCMPAEIFGPDYPFLSRDKLLSFDDIVRIVQVAEKFGVEKVRLTGGEPLLRRGIDTLISRLRAETTVEDIALTTNGLLLARDIERLKKSGLGRVNLSLDALDPETFRAMSGGLGDPERVLHGLNRCLEHGLKVKINSVIKRGVNEGQIIPLMQLGMKHGVEVRFIEYMDVGASNGWERTQVFSETEILEVVTAEFGTSQALPVDPTAVARNFLLKGQREYRWGIIASVTRPFCGGCVRARIAADGKLFTCLFSDAGHDLRPYLGSDEKLPLLEASMAGIWGRRKDRYSEQRGAVGRSSDRVEMSYIGG